jgi:hypothetical protein
MRGFILILMFLTTATLFAQEVPVSTEQQLENLGEESVEDDALLQQLAFYQKHPLNLDEAGAEELSLLRFITGLQIQSLLRYRAAFGNLLSIYELQAVPGFDLVTIQKMLPFVTVANVQGVREALAERLRGGNHTALFRISRVLEKSRGYDTRLRTHYLGNRNHLQFRFAYQYKNLLYYGLVADKDAGEPFFKGAQKLGFDFYSFHCFIRNLGRIKALALGDYSVNLGQGLTQWNSLAFGKSADVMSLKRQLPVLLPYRSAGEFYFSRGAATTLRWGRWEATAFLSFKKISGNLATDSVERFTAFATSGYYRTRAEMENRNRITHFSGGGNLSFRQDGLKLGLNAISHHFSVPLQKRDEPYNRFAFAGRRLFLASLDYSYTYNNIHLFGEWATDQQWHRAMVHGALVSVDPKVDLSLFYRYIDKAYQSPFGNAFTESTLPSNETGLYAGLQIRPAPKWQIAAYADFYRFPFLKYRVSAPTYGRDYLAQLTHIPEKKTEIYLRFRTESKPLNTGGYVIDYPVDQKRTSLRLHLVTQLHPRLSLKTRTEMVWYQRDNDMGEEGFLLYAETVWDVLRKLRVTTRLQFFETSSYDSRLYAYESDVLYSFSTPTFFDKGWRFYFNTSWQACKQLTFWLRFSQTLYSDKERIGSGLDAIEAKHKSDLRMQVLWTF